MATSTTTLTIGVSAADFSGLLGGVQFTNMP
jgi:hypothetical protein